MELADMTLDDTAPTRREQIIQGAYDTLRKMIQKKSEALSVYMCMESKEVWEGVTGHTPRADKKLDVFFDL